MTKERRFSYGTRVLGALCVLLFAGTLTWVLLAGISLVSGSLLASAAVGLVIPCILSGESVSEVALGLVDLLIESISTLVEAVVDFFASLF